MEPLEYFLKGPTPKDTLANAQSFWLVLPEDTFWAANAVDVVLDQLRNVSPKQAVRAALWVAENVPESPLKILRAFETALSRLHEIEDRFDYIENLQRLLEAAPLEDKAFDLFRKKAEPLLEKAPSPPAPKPLSQAPREAFQGTLTPQPPSRPKRQKGPSHRSRRLRVLP